MSLCLFYAYLCSKKDMNKIILSVFALLLYSCGTTKTNIVTRENLLYLHLNEKHTLSNIEVERIVIPEGGKADYHLHPCPVFGYVRKSSSDKHHPASDRQYQHPLVPATYYQISYI